MNRRMENVGANGAGIRISTSNDIFDDIQNLSVFKPDDDENRRGFTVYNTWGRGKQCHSPDAVKDYYQSYEDDMIIEEHYDQNAHSIMPAGRGKLLQMMREKLQRNMSSPLEDQIRGAVGVGYSNDLIERNYGQNAPVFKASDVYEDAEENEDSKGEGVSTSSKFDKQAEMIQYKLPIPGSSVHQHHSAYTHTPAYTAMVTQNCGFQLNGEEFPPLLERHQF